jgi:hypothetical protein
LSGIPRAYDVDARLAVMAVMTNRVTGTSHRQFVRRRAGIGFNAVYLPHKSAIKRNKMYHDQTGGDIPVYNVIKGSAKFQYHLLLPRKRMPLKKSYYTHDVWPFEEPDAGSGEYTAIHVRCGRFQLSGAVTLRLGDESVRCPFPGGSPPGPPEQVQVPGGRRMAYLSPELSMDIRYARAIVWVPSFPPPPVRSR